MKKLYVTFIVILIFLSACGTIDVGDLSDYLQNIHELQLERAQENVVIERVKEAINEIE